MTYRWEMKIDPATGWYFFVDHVSKCTTWNDPRWKCQDQMSTSRLSAEDVHSRLKLLSQHYSAAQHLLTVAKRFSDHKNSKPYVLLEEQLTALLLLVDQVQASDNMDIRTARKEVVNTVQYALMLLENKL